MCVLVCNSVGCKYEKNFVKELNLRDYAKMKHSVAKTYDLDSSQFTMRNNFNYKFDMI